MTFAITVTDTTNVSVQLATSGLTDGAASQPSSLALQVSPRVDFQFCVCPTYSVPADPSLFIAYLNQRSDYFFRAKRRYSNGTIDNDWSEVAGARTKDGAAQATAPGVIMVEPTLLVVPVPILGFADPGNQTVPGYPMVNLNRDSPTAWRAVATSNSFTFCFNAPSPIDTIALLNSNLPETSILNIKAGGTIAQATGASPLFQTGNMPFRASANLPGRNGYHGLFRLGAKYSYPWWAVTFFGDLPPANMIHLEHMVAGVAMVSKNYSNDKNEAAAPLTTISRNRSGAVDRVYGRPMRKADFDLSLLSEAQYETVYGRLWQQQNNPVLVVPNTKAGGFLHDRILYGELSQARIVSPSSPRFSMSLSVNSII